MNLPVRIGVNDFVLEDLEARLGCRQSFNVDAVLLHNPLFYREVIHEAQVGVLVSHESDRLRSCDLLQIK